MFGDCAVRCGEKGVPLQGHAEALLPPEGPDTHDGIV